jgi:hypothetical protein
MRQNGPGKGMSRIECEVANSRYPHLYIRAKTVENKASPRNRKFLLRHEGLKRASKKTDFISFSVLRPRRRCSGVVAKRILPACVQSPHRSRGFKIRHHPVDWYIVQDKRNLRVAVVRASEQENIVDDLEPRLWAISIDARRVVLDSCHGFGTTRVRAPKRPQRRQFRSRGVCKRI